MENAAIKVCTCPRTSICCPRCCNVYNNSSFERWSKWPIPRKAALCKFSRTSHRRHDTSGEICTRVNRLLEPEKSPLLVSLREQRYCLAFSLCEKACLKKKKKERKKKNKRNTWGSGLGLSNSSISELCSIRCWAFFFWAWRSNWNREG